jgi:hypothetical protein
MEKVTIIISIMVASSSSSSSSSSLITGFLSPDTSPLQPIVHPTTQASSQIVALSLLCAMFLVQLFFFSSESIECLPGIFFQICFNL